MMIGISGEQKLTDRANEDFLTIDYLNQIKRELEKANKAFPFFTSLHEGYAVLKEEVEEFWFEVKLLKYNETHEEMDSYLKIEKELIQIAAMALKNLHFVNEAKKTIQGKSK